MSKKYRDQRHSIEDLIEDIRSEQSSTIEPSVPKLKRIIELINSLNESISDKELDDIINLCKDIHYILKDNNEYEEDSDLLIRFDNDVYSDFFLEKFNKRIKTLKDFYKDGLNADLLDNTVDTFNSVWEYCMYNSVSPFNYKQYPGDIIDICLCSIGKFEEFMMNSSK